MAKGFPRAHPGAFLKSAYIDDQELEAAEVARDAGFAEETFDAFLNGAQDVTAELAEKLAAYFGSSRHFWLNMQATYDAKQATRII